MMSSLRSIYLHPKQVHLSILCCNPSDRKSPISNLHVHCILSDAGCWYFVIQISLIKCNISVVHYQNVQEHIWSFCPTQTWNCLLHFKRENRRLNLNLCLFDLCCLFTFASFKHLDSCIFISCLSCAAQSSACYWGR